MTLKRIELLSVIASAVLFNVVQSPLSACSQPPGYGFWVSYTYQVFADDELVTQAGIPGTGIRATYGGAYDSSTTGTTGTTTVYTTGTPSTPQSLAQFSGVATPAYWTLRAITGTCSDPMALNLVTNHLFQPSNLPLATFCSVFIRGSESISPNPFQWDNGGNLQISSANFSDTYGNLLVEIYALDEYSNGTPTFSGTFPLTSGSILGNVPSTIPYSAFSNGAGTYAVVVYNAQSGGVYYEPADAGDMSTYN